jgi:prevent-host-death family protein
MHKISRLPDGGNRLRARALVAFTAVGIGYNEGMVAATNNIPVENASPDLSRLVERASAGLDVVITRAGQPVVRIVSIPAVKGRPKAGYGKGTILQMADDFDASSW